MSVLGASLPRVLMPALPGNNDVGFFEPSRIVEIHDELLLETPEAEQEEALHLVRKLSLIHISEPTRPY